MTTLQFSLFFVALLIGYVLVHLRLVRFESYLREITMLKTLNERLKGVAENLERVRLDRTEERLVQLHEDLLGVQEATARVERALRREAPAAPPMPVLSLPTFESNASDRIRAAVEARLLALGYGRLRLLTDLSGATLDEAVEIVVECERDHMPCKGKVVTRNGMVTDVHVQTSAQMFPSRARPEGGAGTALRRRVRDGPPDGA